MFASLALALAAPLLAATPEQWVGKKLPVLRHQSQIQMEDLLPAHIKSEAPPAEQPARVLPEPGRVTVMTTAEAGCVPCTDAVAAMRPLHAKYGPAGVRFAVVLWSEEDRFAREDAIEVHKGADAMVLMPFVYGKEASEWVDGLGFDDAPSVFVVDATGTVRRATKGWTKNSAAELDAYLAKLLPPAKPATGGLPDAMRRGRARLLSAARADEALLAAPEDPAARGALLARAIASLEKDVATLDAASGGMPPAEILRFGAHYRNALDRARAGVDAAFAPLPEELSPLAVDRLERRILLFAGLDAASRARVLSKLALAKKLVLTMSGNRRAEIVVIHAGQRIDPDPKDADLDLFWASLASPAIRQGWFTGNDLRTIYVHQTGSDLPEKAEHLDAVFVNRLRDLSRLFESRFLYDEVPPSIVPGDLLSFVLPWKDTSTVFVVRSAEVARLETEIDVVDLDAPGANLGETSSRPFPLSLSPMEQKKRYVRPGLLWMRPRVPADVDVKKLLRPIAFRARDFPWRPQPPQLSLRFANAGIEPEALVRHFVERAGGGMWLGGMPLDEQQALTTWTAAPQLFERTLLASGYDVIPQKGGSDTERTFRVAYHGATQRWSFNGSRYDSDGKPLWIQIVVKKTEDGWKIDGPPAIPGVLLLARSRIAPAFEDRPGENAEILGGALYAQKRWEESAKKYETAAGLLPKSSAAAYNAACSYALAGKTSDALLWLGRAIDRGYSDRKHAADDPDLASLRGKPEFDALLQRIKGP